MKNFFKHIKKSKGFALLFAVLASSLLLSIGLSIFTLTVKELNLSSYSRESQFSFYAADSGAECALYWDLKGNNALTFATSTDSNPQTQNIECGSATISPSVSSNPAETNTSAVTTFTMPLNDASNEDYCALVTVSKYQNVRGGVATTIDSRGYNICSSSGTAPNIVDTPTWGNPNLVERALDVTYGN